MMALMRSPYVDWLIYGLMTVSVVGMMFDFDAWGRWSLLAALMLLWIRVSLILFVRYRARQAKT